MSKPKAQLLGQDGNIFNLISIASKTLKESGQEDKAKKMREEVFDADSYQKALIIISRYVDIE